MAVDWSVYEIEGQHKMSCSSLSDNSPLSHSPCSSGGKLALSDSTYFSDMCSASTEYPTDNWLMSDCVDYPLLSPELNYSFQHQISPPLNTQYDTPNLESQVPNATFRPLQTRNLNFGTVDTKFAQAKLGLQPAVPMASGYFDGWQTNAASPPNLSSETSAHLPSSPQVLYNNRHGSKPVSPVKRSAESKPNPEPQPSRRKCRRPPLKRNGSDCSQEMSLVNEISGGPVGQHPTTGKEPGDRMLGVDCGGEMTSSSLPATRGRGRLKPGPRLPHNQVERKYREGINSHLQALRRVLPPLQRLPGGCESDRDGDGNMCTLARPSKATILATATAYIKQIETEKQKLAEENRILRRSATRHRAAPGKHSSPSLSPKV